MPEVTAFLDTNIFLHYQPVTQIPWREVLGCESVNLAVAQVVLEELDEKKDLGRNERIQDRARAATHLVERADRGEQPEDLEPDVSVRFVEEPVGFDFEGAQLSRDVRDDRLVATAVAYSRENPDTETRVVSGDATPRLKARRLGCAETDLPDEYRLDVESPAEKELRKLREQKREREAATPDLQVVVLSGSEPGVVRAEIEPVRSVPEEEIEAKTEELSDRFHEIADGRLRSPRPPAAAPIRAPISKEEKERFEEEFDEWLENYEQYLRAGHTYEQIVARSVEVHLGIHNGGKVPARNIDVNLHVEGDAEVWTEDDWPREPEEPDPPRKPLTWHEQMRRAVTTPLVDPATFLGGADAGVSLPDRGEPGWRIRNSESVKLSVWREQIKQDVTHELPPFWIVFLPDVKPASFRVTWELRAENVPGTTDGEFPVVVNAR